MMDFVFDYISVNAFWTIVLIVHALLAVATLGALTHQAMSVAMPARQAAGPAGFVTRFRGVYGCGLRNCDLRLVGGDFCPGRLALYQIPDCGPHST